MQFQPLPPIDVAVRPEGTLSIAVTGLLVGACPLLDTVMVYSAPVWPWAKFPSCVLAMARVGAALLIEAVSLAVWLEGSPPPDTVAVLVTVGGALTDTLADNWKTG